MKQMNSLVLRDSLRNERAKALTLEADLTEKREQLKAQISKLNTLNNQAEEEMVQLRKRYMRHLASYVCRNRNLNEILQSIIEYLGTQINEIILTIGS